MTLNRAVYLNTLRWFFSSSARVIACGLMAFFAYLVLGGAAKLDVNGLDAGGLVQLPSVLAAGGDKVLVVLAWILGVGVIRREVASGAVHLVFTRPLSRSGYLLSKWAALATLSLGFLVFCYGVLWLRGGADIFSADMGSLFAAQAVQVLALAAVLTCFSASPFNLGELGLLLLAVVALWIVGHYGDSLDSPALRAVNDVGFRILFPRVGASQSSGPGLSLVAGGQVDCAASLAFNAGVTVAALAAGAAMLARREFSYSDGAA